MRAADVAASGAPTARPFRVLGVQHVAVGAPDKQRLRHLWVDLLGFAVVGHIRNEKENVDEDICRLDDAPLGVEIDLMQPLDIGRKPAVHEPALNHLGLWIDDLRKAVAWLEAQGVRFTPGGIRRSDSGHDICFIHPKGNALFAVGGEGVLIELIQAPAALLQSATTRSPTDTAAVPTMPDTDGDDDPGPRAA